MDPHAQEKTADASQAEGRFFARRHALIEPAPDDAKAISTAAASHSPDNVPAGAPKPSGQGGITAKGAGLDFEALLSSHERLTLKRVRERLSRHRYKVGVELTRDGRMRFIAWHGVWGRHFYALADVNQFADGLVAARAQSREFFKWGGK